MNPSYTNLAIICLSITVTVLSVISYLALRETAKCGKNRAVQDKRIIDLLCALDESHGDQSKNYRELTEKTTSAIVQVGKIVEDLHRYFENNALTRKLPTVQISAE